jgi:sugar lactone lactonase YvrE
VVIVQGVMAHDRQNANQLNADRERQFALPFTGLRLPHGVAVDAAGNVYVSDTHTNRVVKLTPGSNTQSVLPFTGLDLCGDTIDESTGGVAVDTTGNVYVADTCHNRVLQLAPGSSAQNLLPFSGLDSPEGVAVDIAGSVYVADRYHGRVVKLSAGSSADAVLPSFRSWGTPDDVAVDARGTVYVGRSRTITLRASWSSYRRADSRHRSITLPHLSDYQVSRIRCGCFGTDQSVRWDGHRICSASSSARACDVADKRSAMRTRVVCG